MKVIRFILDYWYIPLIAVGGIFLYKWIRGSKKPYASVVSYVKSEIKAIDAQREARNLKIQIGTERAKQQVIDKYKKKNKELSSVIQARAKELEDDPEKLAKALSRLTDF